MRKNDSKLFIGTSGWNYDHWKGAFYPDNCAKRKWLEFYTGKFDTVEVNATFYRTMKPQTVENWRLKTPDGFVWAVKANRFITHVRKLRNTQESLARFFETVQPLRGKLGPILFQLPPSLNFEPGVFEAFCGQLPQDKKIVIEARHASWLESEPQAALKRHNIAWCMSDTAGRYPYLEAVTSDFIYVRLHGSRKLYASEYTEDELQGWKKKIHQWDLEAYVYFDNDASGYAPKNALRLKEIMGHV
jgi:uncharacterized protein YecE (DUF72 family)